MALVEQRAADTYFVSSIYFFVGIQTNMSFLQSAADQNADSIRPYFLAPVVQLPAHPWTFVYRCTCERQSLHSRSDWVPQQPAPVNLPDGIRRADRLV